MLYILDSPLILSVGLSGQKETGRTQVMAEPYSKASRRSLMFTRKILTRNYGDLDIEERRPLIVETLRTRTGNDDPMFKFGSQKKPKLGLTNKTA